MKSISLFLVILFSLVLVGCGNSSIYRPNHSIDKVCTPPTESGGSSGNNGRVNVRNTVRETCTWVDPYLNASCRETIVTNNNWGPNGNNFNRVTNQTCTWVDEAGRNCRSSRSIRFNNRTNRNQIVNFDASPVRNSNYSCN